MVLRDAFQAVGVVERELAHDDREERRDQLKVVKTGTDGTVFESPDYDALEKPSVFRSRSTRPQVEALDFNNQNVTDSLDIPAFLRRQAD